MQTFLPYSSFIKSAQCLDYRRLGKQRVEAYQIYRTLIGDTLGWRNHPAVKMWEGYKNVLAMYHNEIVNEWVKRGFKNNMKFLEVKDLQTPPTWLGNKKFHASHRSNLLRKNEEYYRKFGWNEPTNLPYIWPINS